MEGKTVYFEDRKGENTEVVFKLVEERINALGIEKIILASTTGTTARKAMDFFKDKGVKLIIVPHQHDFLKRENRFPEELVATLRDAGHAVHFGTMLFHTEQLYGSTVPTVMANLLRCFSQGVKVCFEITLSVTDAGYLKIGEKVIAIAGSAKGSDTVLVMQAASSHRLKSLRVNEILCKPLNPLNIDELLEKTSQENS